MYYVCLFHHINILLQCDLSWLWSCSFILSIYHKCLTNCGLLGRLCYFQLNYLKCCGAEQQLVRTTEARDCLRNSTVSRLFQVPRSSCFYLPLLHYPWTLCRTVRRTGPEVSLRTQLTAGCCRCPDPPSAFPLRHYPQTVLETAESENNWDRGLL